MTEEKVFKNYPHKHLLGIEGLLPDSINYLINLSKKYANYLEDNNQKLDDLKNKTCINLYVWAFLFVVFSMFFKLVINLQSYNLKDKGREHD